MKYHLISIGVSKHQESSANLQFAAKDAVDFHTLLKQNLPDIGYEKLLTDGEATLGQIQSALGKQLFETVKPEDAVVFFYSGHGVNAEDPLDNTAISNFLVPFDTSLSDITASALSVDYLRTTLDKLICSHKFVFVDACFSGSINSKAYPTPLKKALKATKTLAATIDAGEGYIRFSASADDEEALEDPDNRQGLFTHCLLTELQKERDGEQLSVSDIFTPVIDGVVERAKALGGKQTPTVGSKQKGNVYLPVFRNRLVFKPSQLEVPQYPELVREDFPSPRFEVSDIEAKLSVEQMTSFVIDSQEGKVRQIAFRHFCRRLMGKLQEDWNAIHAKYDGQIDKLPDAVAELENASFHWLMLAGVVALYGDKDQMNVVGSETAKIVNFSAEKSGLTVMLTVPEIIIANLVYVVGLVCLEEKDFSQLKTLLETPVYFTEYRNDQPIALGDYTSVHYCDALSGHADKVGDHIREFLPSLEWLSVLIVPSEPLTDLQLQVNFLLGMFSMGHGEPLYADFGRFYASRLTSLVRKIKYDDQMRQQLADLLGIEVAKLQDKLAENLNYLKTNRFGGDWWHSIEPSHLLPPEADKPAA